MKNKNHQMRLMTVEEIQAYLKTSRTIILPYALCEQHGFHLPLDSFRIVLGDTIRVEQHVDGREYNLREFDLDDGYRYACCSVREIGPIQRADLGSLI